MVFLCVSAGGVVLPKTQPSNQEETTVSCRGVLRVST